VVANDFADHAFDRQAEPVRVVALCHKEGQTHAVKCILALELGRNEAWEKRQEVDFRKLALPCEFK
jgi:hypothetical protein